jgi:hypothetical protein
VLTWIDGPQSSLEGRDEEGVLRATITPEIDGPPLVLRMAGGSSALKGAYLEDLQAIAENQVATHRILGVH